MGRDKRPAWWSGGRNVLALRTWHAASGRWNRRPIPLRSLLQRTATPFVLDSFQRPGYWPAMPDDEKLRPADPSDIAGSIAFALLFSGRKRVHMAAIAADRIVRHLERAGFVVMKKPPIRGGGDNPGRTGTPGR
jgi:hypothetical protein